MAVQVPSQLQGSREPQTSFGVHAPALSPLAVAGWVALFGVEVSVLVTVGDGDCEEVVVGASVGSQSVQSPLQLSTTWSQRRLGFFSTHVPLICGFRRVTGQGLLNAALVLRATADIAVVGMLWDDLLLPLQR